MGTLCITRHTLGCLKKEDSGKDFIQKRNVYNANKPTYKQGSGMASGKLTLEGVSVNDQGERPRVGWIREG